MKNETKTSDGIFTRHRDNKLIKETLSGKTNSFAHLMAIYQNKVAAVGYSFFHNASDTEDFVQEVFIKAFIHLSSFKGDSSFSTWLTRIAYTTAINSEQRKKEYISIADEALLPSSIDTPEDVNIKRLTALAVKEAVQELPEQYAACLDLYFFHDLSYVEIAIITDLPINTIKSNIFRAKKILRKKLKDFAQEGE